MSDKRKIFLWLSEAVEINEKLKARQIDKILAISKVMIKCLRRGGKIILFGNGGSAADAQHIAAELVGRFFKERKALAAVTLTANTSALTAIANDYDYGHVFARQIEAIGNRQDIAFGISTSGNSPNVLKAIIAAKSKGMTTIALAGRDGGKVSKLADYSLIVPSDNAAHIQEAHIVIGHILCALVEDTF